MLPRLLSLLIIPISLPYRLFRKGDGVVKLFISVLYRTRSTLASAGRVVRHIVQRVCAPR